MDIGSYVKFGSTIATLGGFDGSSAIVVLADGSRGFVEASDLKEASELDIQENYLSQILAASDESEDKPDKESDDKEPEEKSEEKESKDKEPKGSSEEDGEGSWDEFDSETKEEAKEKEESDEGDEGSEVETKKKVSEFLRDNPEPSDGQIHSLAEELGMEPDDLEEMVYSMLTFFVAGDDQIPGGVADGISSEEFDPTQIEMGVAVEKEHTSDPNVAEEIATDHLAEFPDYYDRLQEMEDSAKEEMASSDEYDSEGDPKEGSCKTAQVVSLEDVARYLNEDVVENGLGGVVEIELNPDSIIVFLKRSNLNEEESEEVSNFLSEAMGGLPEGFYGDEDSDGKGNLLELRVRKEGSFKSVQDAQIPIPLPKLAAGFQSKVLEFLGSFYENVGNTQFKGDKLVLDPTFLETEGITSWEVADAINNLRKDPKGASVGEAVVDGPETIVFNSDFNLISAALFAADVKLGKVKIPRKSKGHSEVRQLTVEELLKEYPEYFESYKTQLLNSLEKAEKSRILSTDRMKSVFPDLVESRRFKKAEDFTSWMKVKEALGLLDEALTEFSPNVKSRDKLNSIINQLSDLYPGVYTQKVPAKKQASEFSGEVVDELKKAESIINDLWALAQKFGIPDDAGWPYMRFKERHSLLTRLEEGSSKQANDTAVIHDDEMDGFEDSRPTERAQRKEAIKQGEQVRSLKGRNKGTISQIDVNLQEGTVHFRVDYTSKVGIQKTDYSDSVEEFKSKWELFFPATGSRKEAQEPLIDEMNKGDRVTTPDGSGTIGEVDLEYGLIVVDLDKGGKKSYLSDFIESGEVKMATVKQAMEKLWTR